MQRRNILVFRIGRLGDTIVALPALHSIRKSFPGARIVLLTDVTEENHPTLPLVLPKWTGVYDEVITYRSSDLRGTRLPGLISLMSRLRTYSFDTVLYLPPSDRSPFQVVRDKWFFRLCGATRLIGFYGQRNPYLRTSSGKLKTVPHETDYLLSLLQRDGISTNGARTDLGLCESERMRVDNWLTSVGVPTDRHWVAFGPGSRMAAKQWPLERFVQIGSWLIREFGFFPVVFGGNDEAALGQQLVDMWNDGLNAAGILSIREAAECIRRCSFYVGNDTGTMHLAAAVSTRCVAIFSARENPGRWEPYGSGHIILRHQVPCEGCMQSECDHPLPLCLSKITVEQVIDAIRLLLKSI